MDQQATSLLALLKRPAAPSDAKLTAINALKSDIKHYRVPENAQATIFECVRLAITQQASASLAGAAFSTLGHLLKRLKIQDPAGVAITQLSPRLYSAIIERLGDLREQIRTSASSALCEMWHFLAQDVEKIIKEDVISGSNARAKEAGMQWVVRMHKDENMPFKSFVGPVVANVEDADGTVRDAAKHALIELFTNAPSGAKLDLKRQLKAHSVRHAIETQILTQIGSVESKPQSTEEALPSRSIPQTSHEAALAKSLNSEAAQPPSPQEVVTLDPMYLDSERELNDTFRSMSAQFEGKETEQNWIPRDKSVTTLRKLLKGNAPQDYHQAFMAGVKGVMEGVLKVANSLRTTMSSNGCQLVQEYALILGPAIDNQVEILLQSFIKMSSATKHIAAENGRVTTDTLLQNCSYNVRMMQHIWSAIQEKNAQLRQCTPQWLTTILKRQAGYKTHFESSGGLELAEKCIRKGLDDANPKVKEAMRAVYWTFARTWPERAEMIMNKLDPKSRSMLEKDSNNPNAGLFQSQTSSGAISRSTTPHRTALKDMMAEQRRAKSAARETGTRPTSAMATTTPVRSSANRAPSRLRGETRAPPPVSNAPNSKNSLMSGPVRRPRKPEIQRPMTADPYASKRMLRPETPSNEQETPKDGGASRSSIPVSSASKHQPASRDTSPLITRRAFASSTSRPTSKDSNQSLYVGEHSLRKPQSTILARHEQSPANSPEQHIPHSRDSSRTLSHHIGSPELHNSPLKAMYDAARAKLDRPTSSSSSNTINHAPMADPFKDEDKIPRKDSPIRTNHDVSIYEDPEQHEVVPVDTRQQVLSERPVNGNVQLQSPMQSPASSRSPASPNGYQESATPNDRAELMRNRRLLISGIERIRSCTLDVHGFRKMQEISKLQDIWDGGERYDELMGALLTYFTTNEQDAKSSPVKGTSLKTQGLGIVRALLTIHVKYARSWYDRVLIALLACRKHVSGAHSHIIADLERIADDIVRVAAADTCVDALIDHLSRTKDINVDGESSAASTSTALEYLQRLVLASRSKKLDLGEARKLALAHTASLYLEHADVEVRKMAVDLACEVYTLFTAGDVKDIQSVFWQQFDGVSENRKDVITYYIERGRKQTLA